MIQTEPTTPLSYAVLAPEIVRAMQACEPAVGLLRSANLEILDQADWLRAPDEAQEGYTLRTYARGAILNQLKIAPAVVACTTSARIAAFDAMPSTTAEIVASLSLTGFDDTPGMDAFKAAAVAGMGEAARSAIYFSETHAFTFEMVEFDGDPVIVINTLPKPVEPG